MKKTILSLVLISCITSGLLSQNAYDALRYSRIFYGGTARFMGTGGAFGALGADFSVLATNPAGLGIYKSFEISVTPSVSINPSSSEYYGQTGSDTRTVFAMGNFGFVYTVKPYKKNKTSGLQSFSFAFGMNRQNDFNSRIFIHGLNQTSSLMTDWVNELNGQSFLSYDKIDAKYPFDIALGTNANLIYLDTTTKQYHCDAPDGGVYQEKSVNAYGSINELDISFGGNVNDEWYFGATLGIPTIRYFYESLYEEYKQRASIPYFESLAYGQYLETHGTGINFKAGVIYRPVNWFRIGVAVHTPTWYGNMKDTWNSYMFASFDSLESTPQYSPDGYYEYRMLTPFRAIGSMAFIIGQYGLFSAEYEYVNYNQARFYTYEGSSVFSNENENIKASYKTPVNIRCGTEWRIRDLRLRGGFGYYGSPYQDNINDGEKFVASGGIGYRGKHFFFDLSYVWSQTRDKNYLYTYDPGLAEPSYNKLVTNTILTTFGFRF